MINNEIGKITDNGIVEKEYFRQGFIYKNYNNFKDKKGICYISEYQADKITKNSIEGEDYETYKSMYETTERMFKDFNIDKSKHSIENMIEVVFDELDWQCFDSLLSEYIECLEN